MKTLQRLFSFWILVELAAFGFFVYYISMVFPALFLDPQWGKGLALLEWLWALLQFIVAILGLGCAPMAACYLKSGHRDYWKMERNTESSQKNFSQVA